MDARDFAIPPSLAAEGPFIDKLWRDVSSASYKLDIPIDHGLFGISMLSNWDERESLVRHLLQIGSSSIARVFRPEH